MMRTEVRRPPPGPRTSATGRTSLRRVARDHAPTRAMACKSGAAPIPLPPLVFPLPEGAPQQPCPAAFGPVPANFSCTPYCAPGFLCPFLASANADVATWPAICPPTPECALARLASDGHELRSHQRVAGLEGAARAQQRSALLLPVP
jgi:hypothetical protein